MLAYKTVSGTKKLRKLVHLSLQFIAFLLSLIGVWAALKFHNDKGIDNFYSLHSWLGLACVFLFGIQVFFIFLSHSHCKASFCIYIYIHAIFSLLFCLDSGLLDLQPFGIQGARKMVELPCCHGMCSLGFTYMP